MFLFNCFIHKVLIGNKICYLYFSLCNVLLVFNCTSFSIFCYSFVEYNIYAFFLEKYILYVYPKYSNQDNQNRIMWTKSFAIITSHFIMLPNSVAWTEFWSNNTVCLKTSRTFWVVVSRLCAFILQDQLMITQTITFFSWHSV